MDDQLIAAVEQLNGDEVIKLVEQRMKTGKDPAYLQKQIQLGMIKVGILYEKGDYFIADLIMAGEIVKEVLKLILSKPKKDNYNKIGTVLLGTVEGDIHDLGKNIFSSMLEAEGFEVIDLGTDVAPKVFVVQTKEIRPQIIAMSGVLTLAVESMKKTVDALISHGLRDQVKVLIGGNAVNRISFEYIGADAFTNNADEGVTYCKKWVNC
ncbi:MAG: cobalamin B12-binding domain-containing protein [Thermacetogeniaceae bacterium]|jgi:methanogenic corrinoid protein MtbC1|nr:cobalamin-dependent protein [Thermoanaerobacterales bacterium]NLN21807.1 cobalamin-binding protein [Syntrophomonadaceae bacterium]